MDGSVLAANDVISLISMTLGEVPHRPAASVGGKNLRSWNAKKVIHFILIKMGREWKMFGPVRVARLQETSRKPEARIFIAF